tara:strand:+ start:55 stop:327 length:273 start_codon:yes stop_codon:yes gene_type:complete
MQIPMMKELLELYNSGELNETQSLWLKNRKPAEELYDLNSDPHEINNIINSNFNSDILIKLRNDLDNWVIETNDLGEFPEIKLIPKKYLK